MTNTDIRPDAVMTAPTTPGWYRYSGGANVLVFFRNPAGQWYVHDDAGNATACAWGYIEQALSVWDLVLMARLGGEA